jgi:predicted Zn-ribbon and HTH transcriptional regulator
MTEDSNNFSELKLQYQLSNGRWTDCGASGERFLVDACRINNMTIEEACAALKGGKTLRHDSEDWYDNLRSYAAIERERAARPVVVEDMVKCDCGHTVERSQVMSASLGTSCPDCYDEMSN